VEAVRLQTTHKMVVVVPQAELLLKLLKPQALALLNP
jgi:hypothetical protein